MAFDFDKISYEIDQSDTDGRYIKVDVYYDDVFVDSVKLQPEDLIATQDVVARKIIQASVPVARQLLGAIRYTASDQNMSLRLVDRRDALARLEDYLVARGIYSKALPGDGALEFIAWMRTRFDTLTDEQIVNAMTE